MPVPSPQSLSGFQSCTCSTIPEEIAHCKGEEDLKEKTLKDRLSCGQGLHSSEICFTAQHSNLCVGLVADGGVPFPEGMVDGAGNFHMGASPLNRFVPPANLQNLLMRSGNINPGSMRPDMLFRMVNREDQAVEGEAEQHQQQ